MVNQSKLISFTDLMNAKTRSATTTRMMMTEMTAVVSPAFKPLVPE